MKPAGKTPYEIRLDLLQLAFEILKIKNSALADADAKKRWEENNKEGHANVFYVTAPTTEEVIAEADKMNIFISKANPAH